MWWTILGAILNLIGGVSCGLIAYLSYKFSQLDDWLFSLLSFGTLLLSLSFFSYSLLFSLNLLSPHYGMLEFPPASLKGARYSLGSYPLSQVWLCTSLFMLGGYVLLAVGYTGKTFEKPSFALLPFGLTTVAYLELAGVLLASYLLFLVTYNMRKTGTGKDRLAVLAYSVLLSSQLLTTWGLFTNTSSLFLWGVTIRGASFLPSLLVFLTSEKR